MVSLELGSWLVKEVCPITNLAACPLVKSAALMAAAQRMNTEMPFMRNVNGCVTMLRIVSTDYSKRCRRRFPFRK
jgi:hypothetical protein